MSLTLRRACEDDQAQIHALITRERLNPLAISWFNFIVADHDDKLVGAVQIRRHGDGARELGSLVVAPSHRRQGLGRRLIDAALSEEPGHIFMITGREHAAHYRRWDFREVATRQVPGRVRRNYRVGHYGGCIMAVVQRRAFKPLVLLERQALPHRRREQFLTAQWF